MSLTITRVDSLIMYMLLCWLPSLSIPVKYNLILLTALIGMLLLNDLINIIGSAMIKYTVVNEMIKLS